MVASSPTPTAFSPAFGLRSAGLQSTLASKRPVHRRWNRRGLDLNALSTSHILDCGDGVRLTGRHTSQTSGDSRGLVILIHGWEGCHDSSYLYSMAACLFARGYNVFRLNLRDHALTHDLNEEMFHSARMAEVLGAVAAIRQLDSSAPFYVIGFSLGGNFALRVALQGPALGTTPRLTIAISPAIDPGATLKAIDDGPVIFRKYFLGRWRDTLEAKRRAWPHYDFSIYRKLDCFVEVTRRFVADHTEYASLDEYLAVYTLTPAMLMDSPSPIAVISARDDSVIPIRDFEGLAARGSVVSCDLTDRGGHCGFIENWRLDSWAERRVVELLESTGHF
ncbi:MAG: YheT family hydrolase [Panacagrimonas sp.]